jgi:hypothetical protein
MQDQSIPQGRTLETSDSLLQNIREATKVKISKCKLRAEVFNAGQV